MPQHNCAYGNCTKYGSTEEMIGVNGGGFRHRYCSWLHAAGGCLSHMYARNFATYWAELVRRASQTIEEAEKYCNYNDPSEDVRPKT